MRTGEIPESQAPRLSAADIRERLDLLYETEHRSFLVAFYGQCEEQVVDTRRGRFRIVPVESELGLRAALPPPGKDEGERMAFVVPWAGELPLDIAGRFARRGRIQRIGRQLRLMRLFGVVEAEPETLSSPLGDHLLAKAGERSFQLPEGRLTLDAMWSTWLGREWGVELAGGLAELLAWAALDERFGRFVAELQGEPKVRAALDEFLGRKLGPAGSFVWRAWEAGRGRAVLEYAVLFEALGTSREPVVQAWIELKLRHEFPDLRKKETAGASRPEEGTDGAWGRLAATLGATAGAALRAVERRSGGPAQPGSPVQTMRAILGGADARADLEPVRRELVASPRLPSSFRLRLEALGEVLGQAAAAPAPGVVAQAVERLRAIEAHVSFAHEDQRQVVERAEMAVRLAAWLSERADRQLAGDGTSYAEVLRLGRWYVEEGGYVDWARRRARGSAEGRFGQGVQAVVAAVDAARTEQDRGFACGLAEWVRAGRPDGKWVLPIDEALRRVAAEFLKGHDERRLLVLLIDGMAWAQAVELLGSLSNGGMPWAPLAWHGSKKGRIGEAVYPVVLAALPTLTETSRAAFFGGKPIESEGSLGTAKDVERFAAHRELRAFCPAGEVPRLLLRGEGHTADGSASPEALRLVRDRSQRVVGIVINAIDASLKGDAQEEQSWAMANIRSLPDLLEAAREAGRTLLLASDHGHVPADRLRNLPAGDGGARWRSWRGPGETLAEYEVSIPRGPGLRAPPGAAGVVLLADDEHRYGSVPHAGEHGGATLAEVVVPVLLVGCEAALVAADAEEQRALALRPPHVPAWWHYDVRTMAESPAALESVLGSASMPAPMPAPAPPQKVERQLTLPALTPAAAAPSEPAAGPGRAAAAPSPPSSVPSRLRVMLGASPLFQERAPEARVREQTLDVVTYLWERGGVATSAAFAAAFAVLPFRVGGLVLHVSKALNLDGYPVLRFDAAAQQVVLDGEKLVQLFEVEL